MAALFGPDRAAKGKTNEAKATGAPSAKSSFQVPGTAASEKSHDSLGQGSTPGYEFFGKKQKPEAEQEKQKATDPLAQAIETPLQSAGMIRLNIGWDKLLVTQKKICEKAKNIFTRLEGNGNYAEQRRGKMKFRKSSGCILDLDSKDVTLAKPGETDPKKKIA